MIQITADSVRGVFYKDGDYYYCDNFQLVEEKYRLGFNTSALKKSGRVLNPKPYTEEELKIKASIKAEFNPS